jgi:1-acyl-sn-glycerol-3-phosphate acyltransferase
VGFALVRRLARLLLGLFYRRVEVVGAARVPASGPLIVVANHQNALVDPMLVLATIPRHLRPLAKAPLFRHPVIAPFLRLAGAIPVQRRQDPGSDPTKNQEMFRQAADILRAGGAILIFPEGVSQAEPMLMPLRTGAARMALAAGDGAPASVTVLPVGLIFHEPGTFRTGWALVLAGDPVPLGDLVELSRTGPEAAVRELTGRLEDALRRLIVEARDRRLYRLAEVAEAIERAESEQRRDPAARTAWLRQAVRGYRYLSRREPARIDALASALEGYARELDLAGVSDRELDRTYPRGIVWRYALREAGSLLLGLPLALAGVALHAVPYHLTRLAAYLGRPSGDTAATYKLAAGLVLYPLCWLGEGWLVWRVGGAWLLALFAALLVPGGFFALAWWARLDRVRRDIRGFVQFLFRPDLHGRLLGRRRALLAEMQELARRVPPAVMAGDADDSA